MSDTSGAALQQALQVIAEAIGYSIMAATTGALLFLALYVYPRLINRRPK